MPNDPPKKTLRSPFFKRLAARVQQVNATPEDIQQLQDIHRATDPPRYPDPTGVSGKIAKWPITDTLVKMLGADAPSISGVPFVQGDWAPGMYYSDGTIGQYNKPREGIPNPHISIAPFIVPTPWFSDSAVKQTIGTTAAETLVHEFGHALEARIKDSDPMGYGAIQGAMYAAPTRDPYSRTSGGERFAQTFRNGMRFVRAQDTTGIGAANDSIPGTTAMYQYLKKAYFPK